MNCYTDPLWDTIDKESVGLIFPTNSMIPFIVDKEFEHLNDGSWHTTPEGYCARNLKHSYFTRKRKQYLHRIINNTLDRLHTDHINRISKDCRKSNLRSCNHSQNAANKPKTLITSSKFKGVSYRKDRGKWHAVIKHKGIVIHLGSFLSEEDAAKAYNKKAIEIFGEFASINNV